MEACTNVKANLEVSQSVLLKNSLSKVCFEFILSRLAGNETGRQTCYIDNFGFLVLHSQHITIDI